MIIKVTNLKTLKKFVYFPKELYKNCEEFSPPIYSTLIKELKNEVLLSKKYTALLYVKNNKVLGRILYTVSRSKHQNKDIGYFSFFDFYNDIEIVKSLTKYMEEDLKGKIDYIEGTFTPYDPDTRRGILVKGFNEPHTFLTTYNYSYYSTLLENCGFYKAYDTYTLKVPNFELIFPKIERIALFSQKRYDITVSNLNYSNVEADLKAVHEILNVATNDLNYQDAPSMELIKSTLKSLKFFINPNLIKIAREEKTNLPVGFSLTLPDFNEIFKITNGKINLIKFLYYKRKIKKCRGILQYVIPKYQNKGAIAQLFYETGKSMKELNIDYFEGGTIMENNPSSWKPFINLGGEISKIYRIYGKEI